jgi:hypothetical protein
VTFAIAIPRRVPSLVEGGWATWVGPELVPERHAGLVVRVGRGSLVRHLTRHRDGWACTVTVVIQKRVLRIFRVRMHFVPSAWLCPMERSG